MENEVNERDIVWPKFIEDRDIELINRYAMYNDLRILPRATFDLVDICLRRNCLDDKITMDVLKTLTGAANEDELSEMYNVTKICMMARNLLMFWKAQGCVTFGKTTYNCKYLDECLEDMWGD